MPSLSELSPEAKVQPVDEALDKKLFIHTVRLTFMQVRGLRTGKDFLFPQLPPQAVHKEEQVVHRLSTGVDKAPLGAFPAADYRCGIPEFLGAKKCLPIQRTEKSLGHGQLGAAGFP